MNLKLVTTKIRSVLFITLLISLMTSTSIAATYYVDKNNSKASSSNPGTESLPFKTIQQGVNKAVAGDTVYVKTGVYFETVDLKASGSPGKVITFTNYANDIVTIDGSNSSDIYVVDWKGKKNYIIWDGINVRNGARYGLWCEGDYISILNNKIYNNGTMGSTGHTGLTAMRTNYVKIKHNEVYNNGWNGISVANSNNATLEYNIAYDNITHAGMQFMASPSSTPFMMTNNNARYNISYNNKTGFYMRYQENNVFRDNLIVGNLNNGLYFSYLAGSSMTTYQSNTKILNNTFADNGANGILNESATHLTIKNNIFDATKYAIKSNKTTGNIINNNLYYRIGSGISWGGKTYNSLSNFRSGTNHESNGLTGNPLFTDATNNDYTLKPGSVAIDTGERLDIESVARDLEGKARPQGAGFDIGAYEYSQTTIATPVNLRIVPQ